MGIVCDVGHENGYLRNLCVCVCVGDRRGVCNVCVCMCVGDGRECVMCVCVCGR